MIRVFVIASTPMMQAGLHTLLNEGNIQVIGASAVPEAFLEQMPDVVVVADEFQLSDVGRSLMDAHTVALVLLSHEAERNLPLLRSLHLPGWGIVPPDASAEQLRATVSGVAEGFVMLPMSLAQWLYHAAPSPVTALSLDEGEEPLTPREREVLELVSQGLSNKLIARRLQISEHTVKFHISSLSSKLGAASRTDAVRRGLRRGLITL
jgi:DNA-binding NarL/FixJ family response regulator